MCGITGLVDFTRRSNCAHLSAMSASLHHRGPDDDGDVWFDTSNASVGLGFRRLAILDLSSAGHQPMALASNQSWIVFNGEIYNFQEIRKELESLGHTFNSHSDTEVILHSYQQWGDECVTHFIGMFAFCIYDPERKRLFLARDRAGVKPLYYYWKDGLFLFGSELKSLHQHNGFVKTLDEDAIALYFQFGYIPAPYAIFKNCYKLLPGHTLEVNLQSADIKVNTYWDALNAYNSKVKKIGFEDALVETEKLLTNAFNYRMIADVPVGVFLSGGYDSSCVTALLQKNSSAKIKTFTIGFEEATYNESVHAAKVTQHLGTDHHEYICTFREAMDIVPELATIYDEPFGDSSAIPTTLVSRFARQHVTVALSADAGDELFAGYPRHKKNTGYLKTLSTLPDFITSNIGKFIPDFSSSMTKANRIDKLKAVLSTNDPVSRFKIVNQIFTTKESFRLVNGAKSKLKTVFDEGGKINSTVDDLSSILLTEYKTYLSDDIQIGRAHV